MNSRKIVVVGVPFSDNLGDFAIYYSIKEKLKQNGVETVPLDIAGRKEFDVVNSKKSRLKQFILESNFGFVKWVVTVLNSLLVSLRNFSYWIGLLKKSDYVLIGGGNIFSDNYGNFPVKLFFVYLAILFTNKRFSVTSVGVGNNWSFFGSFLFKRLLNSRLNDKTTVRDKFSRSLLNKYNVKNAEIVPDPALMISQFDKILQVKERRKVIAVNVVDWSAIKFSSDIKGNFWNSDWVTFYSELAQSLVNKGYKVKFFTNGAAEDNAYLAKLQNAISIGFCSTDVFFEFVNDFEGLLSVIKNGDFIVSSRLHSIIIATSYSIPSFGLVWDNKVSSFYELLSLEQLICKVANTPELTGDYVACKVDELYGNNVDVNGTVEGYTDALNEFYSGVSLSKNYGGSKDA